jgi:hypothetical protein
MTSVELPRQVANDLENFLIRIESAPTSVRDEVFNNLDPTGYFQRQLPETRRIVSDAISAHDAQHRERPKS